MYEPPPGTKKEEDRNEDSSQPFKFDWQRTWGNAPRGSWVAKDEMINEKPFGIAVRHVRCLKCRKYGHINTDTNSQMKKLKIQTSIFLVF